MKKYAILLGLAAMLLWACGNEKYGPEAVQVTRLTCEQRVNPIGVGAETPRLSWQLQSDKQGVCQTAYRLLVASSKEKLAAGEADVWDSGKVSSDQSLLVPYGGQALLANTYYYWKVQVWTNVTASCSESEPALWMTALKTEKDWRSSQWIGLDAAMPWDDETSHARLSARYLRTDFFSRGEVEQATVHIAGVGLYELWINGQRIGDQVMAPMPSEYRKHIMYNSFDVTEQIQNGGNAVGVILGNGRYYAMRQHYKPYKWTQYGYPKMRLVMEIRYRDGRTQSVVSNTSWRLNADGPIISNNEFDGEEYDARKEFEGWSEPGFAGARQWRPAERVSVPAAVLVAQPAEPMRVVQTLQPKSIKQLNARTYIMDMGQNMTGWIRLKVKGEKGRTVTLRFAEALLEDGSLSMANLRDAKVTDKYTLKGDPQGEEWAPRFVTHGFQFVEITDWPGEPKLEDFVGEFVCDDMEATGRFVCSSEVLNATVRNAWWSIRGNYKGMPVDCPQRNERQPWLGDRTMGSYGESFLFNNACFYGKWMQDIEDAQRWDGAIPDVAPAFWNYYSDDITWPAAYFFTCDMLYRQFGDLAPMARHFSSMKLFMDYMRTYYYQPSTGLMTADKYGDWCMPTEKPEIIHSSAPDRITDGHLIATAYFYGLYRQMVRYASLLDRQADVAGYSVYADSLKVAFHRNFYDKESGGYSNNTVTANLLALAYGLVPDDCKAGVVEQIRSKIMDVYGGTMASGIIGNQWLFRQLRAQGLNEVAWLLATTTKYPSFGYMVAQGATSIWELWNGDTAAPSMNSRNHVMQLGDLLIWCFEDLAGIKNAANGQAFKKLVMRPDFGLETLDCVDASYETPYGLVKSFWMKQDGQLVWQIAVPANASALVCLPYAKKRTDIEGEGAKYRGTEGDDHLWEIGSGNYQFTIDL